MSPVGTSDRVAPFDVPLAQLTEAPSNEDVVAILEGIEGVSSAANLQPWAVRILTADERDVVAEAAQDALGRPLRNHRSAAIREVPCLMVVAMNVARAKCRFGIRGATLFGIQDVAAAAASMRQAGWSRGIASHWVREVDLDVLAERLEMRPRLEPQLVLAFGRVEAHAVLEAPPSLAWRDVVEGWMEP